MKLVLMRKYTQGLCHSILPATDLRTAMRNVELMLKKERKLGMKLCFATLGEQGDSMHTKQVARYDGRRWFIVK